MRRCAERGAGCPQSPDGAARRAVSLLIVEDETLLATHIQQLLEAAGFAVAGIASSGAEALLLAGAARCDLVLVDLALAGPLDGRQTALQLGRRFGLPALFLGPAGKATAPAGDAGALGYVEKPLRPSQLFNALQQALAQLGREGGGAG